MPGSDAAGAVAGGSRQTIAIGDASGSVPRVDLRIAPSRGPRTGSARRALRRMPRRLGGRRPDVAREPRMLGC